MQEVIQSINTKVDLTVDATSYLGIADYGKIMVGDKGFEWFSNRNRRKFIQIPWGEVTIVEATIMFKGKYIPRFTIHTKHSGNFAFASKDPKRTLRAIRIYIPAEHIVKTQTFLQLVRGYIRNIRAKRAAKK